MLLRLPRLNLRLHRNRHHAASPVCRVAQATLETNGETGKLDRVHSLGIRLDSSPPYSPASPLLSYKVTLKHIEHQILPDT
jgi:hypothetical protein